MEELTLDDLQEVQQQPAPPALIQVAQLPVIIQHLAEKAQEIAAKTGWAMSLAVSPDTLADVRKVRSDLNKDKAELESQRKQVKQAILSPYEEFEAVYNKFVKIPFEAADRDLASKIHEVEQGIISDCEQELREYFSELVVAENIKWLTWDRMNVKITLTDAKQKTHKKLRDMIHDFVTMKSAAVKSISTMQDAEEIMVEYKDCLSLADAVNRVNDRHRRMEEEAKRREAWEARQAAAMNTVNQTANVFPINIPTPDPAPAVPPLAPPVPVPQTQEDTKVYRLSFAVRGTKPQLVEFKKHLIEYCEKEGLKL